MNLSIVMHRYLSTVANNEIKDIIKVIRSLENRGILFNFHAPLMRVGLLLMKNVLTLLAKRVLLIPLRLAAATSATNAANQKKTFGSSMTILIISNAEMKDIMKIVKSLEESSLLIKGVSETIKNKKNKNKKPQKGRFLCMLVGILGYTFSLGYTFCCQR